MTSNNCNLCNVVKWKTDVSLVKIALIPSNSRPLLQPRVWHVKNRPLQALLPNDNYNDNIKTIKQNEDQLTLLSSNTINNDDYLEYYNPDVKINKNGKIACNDEPGIVQKNMYSGPGWKLSRIHPNTRTALSRPLKHWRKQLFPRQFNDRQNIFDQEKQELNHSTSRGRRTQGGIFDSPNGYFITGKLINKEISCLPIYINTTKEILKSCQQLDLINYGKLMNCSIKTALFKSRPGSYTSNSRYQFNSNKSYLQARAKLHEQRTSVNPSTNASFYLNYDPTNCKNVPIHHSPSNVAFQTQGAVSSRINTRRKGNSAVRQNQYSITNKWGITSPKDYLYSTTIEN